MSKDERDVSQFHLRLGWWAVFVFLAFGIALEGMHGLKLGYYLDLANSTRRHMWTLSHAHGTLLGLVNIAFALSLRASAALDDSDGWQRRASLALTLATLLLPGGFLLGGITIYAGDPGLGVLLVPIGGLALLYAVWLTARRL
jgi:hypothetical protein